MFRPEELLAQFFPEQRLIGYEPLGSGHINDTYLLTSDQQKLVLQRLNHEVFTRPWKVCENIDRVTGFLAQKTNRYLHFYPTVLGKTMLESQGEFWRLAPFIDNSFTVDQPRNPEDAYHAGLGFGQFTAHMADYDGPELHATIPDFHHTPKRLQRLAQAAAADSAGRLSGVRELVESALAEEKAANRLFELGLPTRVTHNDTKINNVLFCKETHRPLCVIDLDTVMPGFSSFDFGDLMRTTVCRAPEDAVELDQVRLEPDLVKALGRGYLEACGPVLTRDEREQMAFSGWLLTFEVAVRFLTDYLEGDTYFKVARPQHNLDRARAQFKLAEEFRTWEPQMKDWFSESVCKTL